MGNTPRETATELAHPDWVRRLNLFGDAVGSARHLVALDPDELIDVATSSTGLDDFAADDGWESGYRGLVTHLDTGVPLTVLGRLSARAEIVRNLQTRLRLAAYWDDHPDALDEEIVEPLFIVGPPRTGTSILLELLAEDPALRPVIAHEAHYPLGPLPGSDRDATEVAQPEQEFWADIHPDFMAMHELRSDLPCECVHFVQPEFRSWHWSMMFDLNDLPDRSTPEANQAIYRFHKRFLQTLQHRDRRRGERVGRFLLKTPAHLGFLPELFATYPDARVVFTHRDPLKFIGSSANLTGVLHWMRSDDVDLSVRGPIMAAVYEILLGGAMQQRIAGAVPGEQITDVHFRTLMADPVAVIEAAYSELGLPFDPSLRTSIPAYLDAKPKGKFGVHRYDPGRLGLDESGLRGQFADYIAYYDVELEDA
ncbi:MAG: sulfotransferase [Actinomycetota bacterium]